MRTGHRGPVIDLPRNSSLAAGTDAGLLLEVLRGHDFSLALWRPGGALRLLPHSPRSDYGLDASPRRVAYGTACRSHDTVRNDYYATCQVLRVFDVVTGKVLSYRTPPGTAGWMPLRMVVLPGAARASVGVPGEQGPGPRIWRAVLRVHGHGRVPEHAPLTIGLGRRYPAHRPICLLSLRDISFLD